MKFGVGMRVIDSLATNFTVICLEMWANTQWRSHGGHVPPNPNPARSWDSPRSEEKIFREGEGEGVLPDGPVTPVTQCRTTTVA